MGLAVLGQAPGRTGSSAAGRGASRDEIQGPLGGNFCFPKNCIFFKKRKGETSRVGLSLAALSTGPQLKPGGRAPGSQ